MSSRVMVMAGGTGGHVFPALAVAEELRGRGHEVFWLGVPGSFEARLVPQHGFPMEWVQVRGLRGNGVARWVAAPLQLLRALFQAGMAVRRVRPQLVLGMGGFVTGPGGVVAKLFGIPLVIHEQNAVPGFTNRILAHIASKVAEAFPRSFPASVRASLTGNPVRPEIAALPVPEVRFAARSGPLRLLILGGSLGAQALNETLPLALAKLPQALRPLVRHQAGRGKAEATQAAYEAAAVEGEVSEFISDMAEAYGWADLAVCRAGALTLTELAAAGLGAILVPYPHAVDDHQTRNGEYLAGAGAARLIPQSALDPVGLAGLLNELLTDRTQVAAMAQAARKLARPAATAEVADMCEELIR